MLRKRVEKIEKRYRLPHRILVVYEGETIKEIMKKYKLQGENKEILHFIKIVGI